jgi:ribosomal protein S18 acetylase RimI-like enzyme
MTAEPPTVELRPVTAADTELLYEVYASTRYDVGRLDWSDEAMEAFLRQQFDAQRQAYAQMFPNGRFEVIVVDGVSAGRLYLDEMPSETRLIDIALLPDRRRRGIGTGLLTDLLRSARERGACVTLHVEHDNVGAQALYDRLGFVSVPGETGDGVYDLLRWEPPIEAVRRVVVDDPAARAALLAISDHDAFTRRAAEIAADHGIAISAAEVGAALRDERTRIRQRWV